MARLARRRYVRAGERELRCTVVEGGWLPGRRCMTRLTVLTEVTGDVIGILRTAEIRTVALVAV